MPCIDAVSKWSMKLSLSLFWLWGSGSGDGRRIYGSGPSRVKPKSCLDRRVGVCYIASACFYDKDYRPGKSLHCHIAILAPSNLSLQMVSVEMIQCSLCAMPPGFVVRKSAEDFLDKIDASMGTALLGDAILECDACSKPTCRQHRYKCVQCKGVFCGKHSSFTDHPWHPCTPDGPNVSACYPRLLPPGSSKRAPADATTVSSTTSSAKVPGDASGADPELPPLKCQKSSHGARQGSSSTLSPSAPPASTPSTCVEPIPQGSYFVQFLRQHDLTLPSINVRWKCPCCASPSLQAGVLPYNMKWKSECSMCARPWKEIARILRDRYACPITDVVYTWCSNCVQVRPKDVYWCSDCTLFGMGFGALDMNGLPIPSESWPGLIKSSPRWLLACLKLRTEQTALDRTKPKRMARNRLPLSQKTQRPPTSDTSTSNASPAAPPPSRPSSTREQSSMTVTSLSASSHGSQPVVEQVMNIPRWPPFAPTSNVAALCGTFHRRQDAFGREWGLTKWERMQLWPPSPALLHLVFGTDSAPVLEFQALDSVQHMVSPNKTLNQRVCKPWNDNRDCTGYMTCSLGPECKCAHVCDAYTIVPPKHAFPEEQDPPSYRQSVQRDLPQWLYWAHLGVRDAHSLRKSTPYSCAVVPCGSRSHSRQNHLDYAPGVKTVRDAWGKYRCVVPMRRSLAGEVDIAVLT